MNQNQIKEQLSALNDKLDVLFMERNLQSLMGIYQQTVGQLAKQPGDIALMSQLETCKKDISELTGVYAKKAQAWLQGIESKYGVKIDTYEKMSASQNKKQSRLVKS